MVDDEIGYRRVMQLMLEKSGYQVVLAADGVDAVAIYAQEGPQISVVLTDLVMPVMDGTSFIRVLRRLNPKVRVIACTGQTEELREDELAALGVMDFLVKPFNLPKLLQTLYAALRRGELGGRAGAPAASGGAAVKD